MSENFEGGRIPGQVRGHRRHSRTGKNVDSALIIGDTQEITTTTTNLEDSHHRHTHTQP